jgi:hypothetical protein
MCSEDKPLRFFKIMLLNPKLFHNFFTISVDNFFIPGYLPDFFDFSLSFPPPKGGLFGAGDPSIIHRERAPRKIPGDAPSPRCGSLCFLPPEEQGVESFPP